MSNKITQVLFFLLCFPLVSKASLNVNYDQTRNFWGVLSAVQKGTGTLASATQLLNETYGQPEGLITTFRYEPKKINESDLTFRELRLDGIGFAYSSNPVQPRLFAWAGYGPEISFGWEIIEVYAARFFAKRVDAASTDLIDRKLVDTEVLNFLGLGLQKTVNADLGAQIPAIITFRSRHTGFFSSRSEESLWYHRWLVKFDADITHLFPESEMKSRILLLMGPQPVPSFEKRSEAWDFLLKVDPFSDPVSMFGLGEEIEFRDLLDLKISFGFYGGYMGGQVGFEPFQNFIFNLQSYGIETSTAFQGQQLRLFGANLNFIF